MKAGSCSVQGHVMGQRRHLHIVEWRDQDVGVIPHGSRGVDPPRIQRFLVQMGSGRHGRIPAAGRIQTASGIPAAGGIPGVDGIPSRPGPQPPIRIPGLGSQPIAVTIPCFHSPITASAVGGLSDPSTTPPAGSTVAAVSARLSASASPFLRRPHILYERRPPSMCHWEAHVCQSGLWQVRAWTACVGWGGRQEGRWTGEKGDRWAGVRKRRAGRSWTGWL